MSVELERARQHAAARDYRGAVKNLWIVESFARTDPQEARGLLEVAKEIQAAARGRNRREADLLVEYATRYLATAGANGTSGTPAQAPTAASTETRPNPVAIAAGLVGGVVLALSVFLPYVDNTTSFARVVQNTLIQHSGWPLLVLGIASAFVAISGTAGKPVRGGFVVLGVLAVAYVVYLFTDKSGRTLYPIVNGVPDTSLQATVASAGIGLYAAAVGAGLVLLAGLVSPGKITASSVITPPALASAGSGTDSLIVPNEPTKKCPDCAETILHDARVCKHCGYRFEPAPAET
jgi:hypothetical protein